jgi:hypothetical protein
VRIPADEEHVDEEDDWEGEHREGTNFPFLCWMIFFPFSRLGAARSSPFPSPSPSSTMPYSVLVSPPFLRAASLRFKSMLFSATLAFSTASPLHRS